MGCVRSLQSIGVSFVFNTKLGPWTGPPVSASGYVGRRLVERLARRGHHVVAVTRHPVAGSTGAVETASRPTSATSKPWPTPCPVLVPPSTWSTPWPKGEDFAGTDRRLATAFVRAARQAGVGRLVYLGGLGRDRLSAHLASRQDIGAVLRGSPGSRRWN